MTSIVCDEKNEPHGDQTRRKGVFTRLTALARDGRRDPGQAWSIGDIVALVDAVEPKPSKRGPYKKRIAA
jgi:hypothetical protein